MSDWKAISIIIAILIVVWFLIQSSNKTSLVSEGFYSYHNNNPYHRNRGYHPYNRNIRMPDFGRFYDYSRTYPGMLTGEWPRSVRYNPDYAKYWYIPAHEYLDKQVNGYGRHIPTNCEIPASTSEYCVDARINEGVSESDAIRACTIPGSKGESCP